MGLLRMGVKIAILRCPELEWEHVKLLHTMVDGITKVSYP